MASGGRGATPGPRWQEQGWPVAPKARRGGVVGGTGPASCSLCFSPPFTHLLWLCQATRGVSRGAAPGRGLGTAGDTPPSFTPRSSLLSHQRALNCGCPWVPLSALCSWVSVGPHCPTQKQVRGCGVALGLPQPGQQLADCPVPTHSLQPPTLPTRTLSCGDHGRGRVTFRSGVGGASVQRPLIASVSTLSQGCP